MSKDKISDYSSTANSNTDIAGINIDEGCAPSGINDAIRTLMAQLKNFQQGTGGDSFNGPFAGTTIAATDTTDASSTTAAAMKTAGGLAVAKKAYIGLDANIYGLTVGRGAGSVSTNTAVGASALAGSNSGTGENVAVGYEALKVNTTGSRNTAVGLYAAGANTTGIKNVAVGNSAMDSNTSGSYNIAIGPESLHLNTTASNNTAVGYQAGYTNSTGAENVFLGWKAGYTTTGNGNCLIGRSAGELLTTGSNNTFVGCRNLGGGAGFAITTGSNNTIIGQYDGNSGGLDIRTASNYIVLSDGAGNPRGYYSGGGNFWGFNNGGAASSTVLNIYNDNASTPYGEYISFTAASPNNTTNYFLGCNDSTTSCFRIWSNGTTSGRSDERLKKNITPANSQLADVMAMEVVNYEWNESIDGVKEIGWVAQQVQQIKPNLVQENDDGFLHLKREPMVAILWKAVQELKAEFDAYKEAHP